MEDAPIRFLTLFSKGTEDESKGMEAKMADEERITGTIKSIDGDIVTVVYKDQSGKRQEIDVLRNGIGKSSIAVGEVVTIEFSKLIVEAKIPMMGSMLEDAIKDALCLIRETFLRRCNLRRRPPPKGQKRNSGIKRNLSTFKYLQAFRLDALPLCECWDSSSF